MFTTRGAMVLIYITIYDSATQHELVLVFSSWMQEIDGYRSTGNSTRHVVLGVSYHADGVDFVGVSIGLLWPTPCTPACNCWKPFMESIIIHTTKESQTESWLRSPSKRNTEKTLWQTNMAIENGHFSSLYLWTNGDFRYLFVPQDADPQVCPKNQGDLDSG